MDYNATKSIAESCNEVEEIGLLRFYLFLRFDASLEVELQEVRNAYSKLNNDGYVEIYDHYIYYKHMEEVMEELAKDELDNKLEDAYEVAVLF